MVETPYCAAILLACMAISSPAAAEQAPNDQGMYAGIFGGLGAATATSLQQQGAVYLRPPQRLPILPINAKGSTASSTSVALGGAHLGYEWNRLNLASNWGLRPAAELEGVYIGKHSPTGEMPVMPRFLGMQYVTVPTTAGVFLANAIFTLETPYSSKVLPYIGLGAGMAFVSIKGSDSANPSEPGINHFNSDPDASDSAFAMQIKAGIKGRITKNLRLFAEYRHLSIDATSYKFGATDYPGLHLPTATWHVNMGRQKYNLFVAGLQYKF
ncbi:outer membrane protein [Pusillimonas caeni]|uniref:outer membrane protein n=1 Tax=Pusillimonas caeni TaxID=1348472 RepID=UPI001FD79783|nr:outer membrane beta-barrel protein [Pusillimonas caeni]